jgi:hypothetical protein
MVGEMARETPGIVVQAGVLGALRSNAITTETNPKFDSFAGDVWPRPLHSKHSTTMRGA